MRRSLLLALLAVLVVVPAAFAGVAGVRDRIPTSIYTVREGDCLVGLAQRVGGEDKDYYILTFLNGDLFPVKQFFHPSHNRLAVGTKLKVPAAWAEELGIETFHSEVAIKPVIEAAVVPTMGKESPWVTLGAIVTLFCALGSITVVRPWNFFRPATGGKPMVPEGVWHPLDALREVRGRVAAELAADPVKAAAVPKPFVITRLWEIKIFGLLQVTYGDGRVERRLAQGQLAWLAQLSDGSQHIILQQCGNDVVFAGNRNVLLKGRYEVVSVVDLSTFPSRELEILVLRSQSHPEPEPEEPVFWFPPKVIVSEEAAMMYPLHPCVCGRAARMIRLESAIRGGGLRRR